MDSPGLYSLGDVAASAINAATTATVVTSGTDAQGSTVAYIGDLDGMLSATLQINFNYGSSGGTSVKATVETSCDQGASWIEVWRAAFGTASEENVVNLSGLTAVGSYTPAALSDDAVKDGLLGQRWRMKIITVGTYAGNASLSGRLIAR
jgi:hypothetical protein